MRTAVYLLGLLLLQDPQGQTSGSIEGFVVEVGTSTPVAGARVNMFGETAASGGLQTTTADASGRCVISNVAPGRYRIAALRGGYVPGQYGERSHGARGPLVTVNKVRGQVVNGVTAEAVGGIGVTLVPRRGTVATGSNQRVSTSRDDTFEIAKIAPGDAWQDQDFIRMYEDRGRPLHIGERGHESVELRLLPRR